MRLLYDSYLGCLFYQILILSEILFFFYPEQGWANFLAGGPHRPLEWSRASACNLVQLHAMKEIAFA